MTDYYLLPDGENGWMLSREGEQVFAGIRTKEDALTEAIHEVCGTGGSLKIHKSDGTFEEERTYPRRDDPKESPG
jgi:hypothetical protein